MLKKLLALLLCSTLIVGCGLISESVSTNIGPTTEVLTIGEEESNENVKSVNLIIDARVLKESENFEKVAKEYQKYIPEDGYFLKDLNVEVYGDFSIKYLLEEASKQKDVAIDIASLNGMAYLKSAGQLEAGLLGNMSGWLYTVNGELATSSIDQQKLQDGDQIHIYYTADGSKEYEMLK